MTARLLVPIVALALCGCEEKREPTPSLVGAFPAPGTYALAGDNLTVWKRVQEPSGAWRFHSYSITTNGTVEYLEELERTGAPENPEEAQDFSEKRQGFALSQSEFEALRTDATLLRPAALGPADPVGGYAGEVLALGCASDPAQPRVAGINFLNRINWGSFVLQADCKSEKAGAAAAVMARIFDRLERAAPATGQPQR